MSIAYPLYAFHTLESHLHKVPEKYSLEDFKLKVTKPPRNINSDKISLKDKYPLFITYNLTKDDSLRGCIGTFSPLPLERGINEYSLIAALQDTRFPPISMQELEFLSVDVTILRDFVKIDDPFDWIIGKHGLSMKFSYDGRRYSGTFLPSVAKEQGWDKEQTLIHLVRKSGFSGRNIGWKELDIQLTRYEGDKSGVTYQEYLKFCDSLLEESKNMI